MNAIDIVVIGLLLWGAVAGFIKGFLTQIISFGAVFLGVYLAFLFSDLIAIFVSEHMKVSPQWSMAVASFIIFIGVFILLHIVGRIINSAFNKTSVGTINHILGAAFGVLKAFLLICAILWLASELNSLVSFIPENLTSDSKLYDMWRIVPWIFPFIKGVA